MKNLSVIALTFVLLVATANAAEPEKPDSPAATENLPLRAELETYARELGDSEFDRRSKASRKLLAAREAAIPVLARTAFSPDAEIRYRSRKILMHWATNYDSHMRHLAEKTVKEFAPAALAEARLGLETEVVKWLEDVGAQINGLDDDGLIQRLSFAPPCKVRDGGMSNLRHLHALEWLHFTSSRVGDAGIVHLQHVKSLKQLYLTKTEITDRGLFHIKELPLLTTLDLRYTDVSDPGLASLEDLPLNQLELAGSKVMGPGLKHLRSMRNLETLTLYESSLTSLNELGNLGSLRVLLAHDTGLTDEGTKNLGELRALEELDLRNTGISDETLTQIAQLSSLKELKLSETAITDTGLAVIAELPSLHTLDLSNTSLSDAGLAQVCKIPNLKVLNLANTKITNAGLAHLQRAKNIETLHLMGNPKITDAGTKHLEDVDSLKLVKVQGTSITRQGRYFLKAALPNGYVTD
jgi:hypothetical protein